MSDDRFVSKVGISAVHEPSPPLHKYTFGQASVFTEQLRMLFEKSSNVLFLFLQKIFDKTVFNSYFLRYIFAASVFFVNGYAFNKSEHSFTVKLRYVFILANHIKPIVNITLGFAHVAEFIFDNGATTSGTQNEGKNKYKNITAEASPIR